MLRNYKKSDAKTIISWIKNERELRLWSADRYNDYPITENDINKNYEECQKDNNFYPLTLEENNKVIGHLILRYPNIEKDIIRLGFIIVDNTERGKGYGKKLINEAIAYAKRNYNPREINLGVFTNNASALECYKKSGFEIVEIEKSAYKFHDEEWDCAEMILKK